MRCEIEVLERPEFEDLEVTRNLALVSLLRKGEFSRGQLNSRDGEDWQTELMSFLELRLTKSSVNNYCPESRWTGLYLS